MTPAPAQARPLAGSEAGLHLRLAQRAFAAVLDNADADSDGAFRAAQRRSAARRTLSALSADDHTRLSRWLAVQLATRSMRGPFANRALARVDAQLAAAIGSAVGRVREDLRMSTDATAA